MQTKAASQLQFIVPQKAQLIFDVNQAYSAYSLPKIQYRQLLPELPDVPIKKQVEEKLEQGKSKNDNQIFKEWNVNYQEDILKRLANNKQLKAQENSVLLDNLRQISKEPPKKKTRMHKTKFKIVKNVKNHAIVEQTMCQYISQNIQNKVPGSASNQDYDASAPFFIPTLEFAEQLNEEKQIFKKKYGVDDTLLRKNKLILEEVVLLRLQKKEKIRQKNKIINQVKEEIIATNN